MLKLYGQLLSLRVIHPWMQALQIFIYSDYRPSVSQLSLVTKYGGLLCPMLWLICALWSKGPMAFRKWFSVWFSALLISFSFSHENVKHKPKSQLSWSKFMIDSSFFICIFVVCFFFSSFFWQIWVSWVSSCLMFNMKIAFDANDVQRMKSKRLMGVERSCHLLTKRFATNSVFGIISCEQKYGETVTFETCCDPNPYVKVFFFKCRKKVTILAMLETKQKNLIKIYFINSSIPAPIHQTNSIQKKTLGFNKYSSKNCNTNSYLTFIIGINE